MTTNITKLIKRTRQAMHADGYKEPEVHFHSGPEDQPVVCYDGACARPRLRV